MSFYFTFIIISLFFFKLACKAYDTNKIVFSICYAFAILIPAILGGYRDLSVGIDVAVNLTFAAFTKVIGTCIDTSKISDK